LDATCIECGEHLHSCMNCALYDPLATQGCHENRGEPGSTPSAKNFCEAFIFRESHVASSREGGLDRRSAETMWNQLFRDA
jgi:hypothetical protein